MKKKQNMIKTARLNNLPKIDDYQAVKVKTAGNVIEIMARQSTAHKVPTTKRISASEYIDMRTGEIKGFKHIENRSDDLKGIARTMALGRDIINSNIDDVAKCRWVTLTYSENMTDTKRLYNDFESFNRRAKKRYGYSKYIICAEPQERGAWHLHCLFIFDVHAPYMDNKTVAEMWKQGFVKVKKLDSVDNVGAYLTAYLGDIELNSDTQKKYNGIVKETQVDEDGKKLNKRFIKGARLSMYPPKFNIFRYSRNCKKPEIEYTDYLTAKEKVRLAERTFSKGVVMIDTESAFCDTILYEYYNTRRKKLSSTSDTETK